MLSMKKYHGLGNDYLVIEPAALAAPLSQDDIRLICSRHYGVGADGILTGPYPPTSPDFGDIASRASLPSTPPSNNCLAALRIFNPDGTEAEKSGNGLRIFARYLFDSGKVALDIPFTLLTLGGLVTAIIHDPDKSIEVDMGCIAFKSPDFPRQRGAADDCSGIFVFQDATFTYCAASIGNPHCVVLDSDASEATAHKYGPAIESAKRFPNRINVQFLKRMGKHDIFIQIWERGAGYTLASGSSASASAAVAVRRGLCDYPVNVHMPGGILHVNKNDNGEIVQSGPVERICEVNWLGRNLECLN